MAQVGHCEAGDAVEVVDVAAGGELAVVGAHGLLGHEVGRDVGDVLAVVGRLGPAGVAGLQAAQSRLHRGAERGDLHAGVVVVELARHRPALRLQQVADAVAERGVAAVAHVQRAGRVGRHELHHHALRRAAARWPNASAAASTSRTTRCLRFGRQPQVDEAGAGDLERLDPALHRGFGAAARRPASAAMSRGALRSALASPIAAVIARSPCALCLGDSNAAWAAASGANRDSALRSASSSSSLAWIIERFYVWARAGSLQRATPGAVICRARVVTASGVSSGQWSATALPPARTDRMATSASRAAKRGATDSLPQRIGRYRCASRLGEGATSEVFLARDEFHDRLVAIKRVRRATLADPIDAHYSRASSPPRPRWWGASSTPTSCRSSTPWTTRMSRTW